MVRPHSSLLYADLTLVFRAALRYQSDMGEDSLDDLVKKLADAVPQGLRAVRADVEDNFRAVLKGQLAKLDLVTREEFEVQEAVLARTRDKLRRLEERLDEIERDAP